MMRLYTSNGTWASLHCCSPGSGAALSELPPRITLFRIASIDFFHTPLKSRVLGTHIFPMIMSCSLLNSTTGNGFGCFLSAFFDLKNCTIIPPSFTCFTKRQPLMLMCFMFGLILSTIAITLARIFSYLSLFLQIFNKRGMVVHNPSLKAMN